MKKTLTFRLSFFFLLSGIAISGIFQSCTKTTEIQPILPLNNSVTIKVKSYEGHDITKHLRIVSVPASAGVVLDTNITGNFEYTFAAKNPNISVNASLSSASPFVCSLEIDGNNKMQAYHYGSCAVTEFDISRDLSF